MWSPVFLLCLSVVQTGFLVIRTRRAGRSAFKSKFVIRLKAGSLSSKPRLDCCVFLAGRRFVDINHDLTFRYSGNKKLLITDDVVTAQRKDFEHKASVVNYMISVRGGWGYSSPLLSKQYDSAHFVNQRRSSLRVNNISVNSGFHTR